VIAVERDARALPALNEIAAAKPNRLTIIQADALQLNEATLFSEIDISAPVSVVSNLPFNVGTPLLVKWLSTDWPPFWSSLTLMFQKEVAQRICAKPGDEAYGRLAVLAAWRTHARILFDVSPKAFVPPPNVTSAVIRIEPLPKPVCEADLSDLEKVTAATFGQRRKMLRGSLKGLMRNPEPLLEAAGVLGTARPEELSLQQFCALARAYRGLRP
jgi:16S rRNA (adenine1518-N6/adenine1519-N6)-dimethyltransferase